MVEAFWHTGKTYWRMPMLSAVPTRAHRARMVGILPIFTGLGLRSGTANHPQLLTISYQSKPGGQ